MCFAGQSVSAAGPAATGARAPASPEAEAAVALATAPPALDADGLERAPVPLNTLLRQLVDRLSDATSSQVAQLLETEFAIAARRREIERSCAATVIVPRPLSGDVRPRDPPPPPPPTRSAAARAIRRRIMRRRVQWRAAPAARRPALGVAEAIAGHESDFGFDDGPALSARFHGLVGMVKHAGALIVVDCWNNRIRQLRDGVVSTLSGGGEEDDPMRDGPGSDARFNFPSSIAVCGAGRVLVTDENHHRVRSITLEGVTTTIGGIDGPSLDGEPRAVAIAKDGTVFVSVVAPTRFDKVCVLAPDGTATALAGGVPGFADGRGEAARFRGPNGMAMSPADGRLYIADTGNHSIRCVGRDGLCRTVAGRPWAPGEPRASVDGDVAVARFHHPAAIAVASDGTVYVGEYLGKRVRQIRDGVVTTLHLTDGAANGLCLDEAEGLLYVATTTGVSTVVVGSALQHRLERADPLMRMWCLMQNPDDENPDPRLRQRAHIAPAEASEDARSARARETLRLLMRCPIVEVAFHVCAFAF